MRRAQYDRKLSLDYYRRAMARMRELVSRPRFYVFSDEPGWWLENGDNGPDVEVITTELLPAIEDFHVMSLCRHFIIANSSFSWWAAWLGRANEKIEVAPAGMLWDNNLDIIPESWEVIAAERD